MSHKRRKVVLVIVEGPSDETALEQQFTVLFNPDDVRIEVMHRDITSDRGSNPSNIVSTVGNLVKAFVSKYGLKRQDLLRVIHITDTDGAFIPDANVVEDANHNGRPEYNVRMKTILESVNDFADLYSGLGDIERVYVDKITDLDWKVCSVVRKRG